MSAWVSATGNPIQATASSVNTWEKFDVVDAGSGMIAFLANANNRYIRVSASAANDPLQAIDATIGDDEKFTCVDNGDGTFALRSNVDGNQYVTCHLNVTNDPLRSSASLVQGWEKFTWGVASGGSTSARLGSSGSLDSEQEASIEVSVYPNPTDQSVKIYAPGNYSLNIFSLDGQELLTVKDLSEIYTVDMAEFQKGIYLVKISGADYSAVRKILLE